MVDNNFCAQMETPFFKTPLKMFDNKEYMNWERTMESAVYKKIYRHLVRAPMNKKLDKKIYEDYYKKGIVASYRSSQEIADFFGLKSRSHVSEHISNMIKKGIIVPHKDVWLNRSITIYELGRHDMGPEKRETTHLFVYFTKVWAEKQLEGEE